MLQDGRVRRQVRIVVEARQSQSGPLPSHGGRPTAGMAATSGWNRGRSDGWVGAASDNEERNSALSFRFPAQKRCANRDDKEQCANRDDEKQRADGEDKAEHLAFEERERPRRVHGKPCSAVVHRVWMLLQQVAFQMNCARRMFEAFTKCIGGLGFAQMQRVLRDHRSDVEQSGFERQDPCGT